MGKQLDTFQKLASKIGDFNFGNKKKVSGKSTEKEDNGPKYKNGDVLRCKKVYTGLQGNTVIDVGEEVYLVAKKGYEPYIKRKTDDEILTIAEEDFLDEYFEKVQK